MARMFSKILVCILCTMGLAMIFPRIAWVSESPVSGMEAESLRIVLYRSLSTQSLSVSPLGEIQLHPPPIQVKIANAGLRQEVEQLLSFPRLFSENLNSTKKMLKLLSPPSPSFWGLIICDLQKKLGLVGILEGRNVQVTSPGSVLELYPLRSNQPAARLFQLNTSLTYIDTHDPALRKRLAFSLTRPFRQITGDPEGRLFVQQENAVTQNSPNRLNASQEQFAHLGYRSLVKSPPRNAQKRPFQLALFLDSKPAGWMQYAEGEITVELDDVATAKRVASRFSYPRPTALFGGLSRATPETQSPCAAEGKAKKAPAAESGGRDRGAPTLPPAPPKMGKEEPSKSYGASAADERTPASRPKKNERSAAPREGPELPSSLKIMLEDLSQDGLSGVVVSP
ncbi:MAG: hypothetical protein HYU64_10185 [Armatimonadetes bacterium]|nr:hypothetical protein [Armatimonadota bacterium]